MRIYLLEETLTHFEIESSMKLILESIIYEDIRTTLFDLYACCRS